jgi:NTP pyrophosphatase (non-canonical NTP hydrolase)
MKEGNFLEPKRLADLQKRIWDIATAHGWHDKPISTAQYCGLIMTEMAEAVEADRNGRRANTNLMADVMKTQAEGEIGLTQQWYDIWFPVYYKEYVKGSIEEEFADVVIRVLDMAQEVHGDRMRWLGYYPWGQVYHEDKSFIENAWYFIREVLNWGTMNISDCMSFMFDWAQDLGIDLWQHIEWKIKYNELRPYKHGGKKY